ncbi:acyl-CoA N-acyltransferase [Catenaria anguillulae PL171]|uniref:Acyl-CoA N-acyltransferase n=1 Tax=Catenaria anguillulae PL171 TaxID=765915 RepID=A0A1Y2HYX6_9FUNG|nr:acyl-CoA N-acyltransferase [Catenaria anguillulae PL171]
MNESRLSKVPPQAFANHPTIMSTAAAAKPLLPTPTIRPIVEADLPAIWQMIYELAEYEKMPDQVVCTVDDLRASLFPSDADVLSGKAVKSARAVVLERELADGEVPPASLKLPLSAVHPTRLYLGFCLYFFNYSTWQGQHNVWVEDLCIREPYRAFGYGSILLQSVIRHALVHHKAKRVEWWVLDWNEPAIQFYKGKVGAKPQDEWTVYRVDGERLERYREYQPPAGTVAELELAVAGKQ